LQAPEHQKPHARKAYAHERYRQGQWPSSCAKARSSSERFRVRRRLGRMAIHYHNWLPWVPEAVNARAGRRPLAGIKREGCPPQYRDADAPGWDTVGLQYDSAVRWKA